jgi:branched-chain amino acid transport system ATP-binding protein
VRQGIGRTFQISRTFLGMTVRENMTIAVEQRCAAGKEHVQAWWRAKPSDAIAQEADANLQAVGLLTHADQSAATLSHGDKKRLELAMTLALKPRLIMLDEPTAGMAPADRGAAVELLRRLKAEHRMTLLLTEHDMGVVFDLATRVMVLNYGETIAMGTPEAVRGDPLVRQVYLGHGADHA